MSEIAVSKAFENIGQLALLKLNRLSNGTDIGLIAERICTEMGLC